MTVFQKQDILIRICEFVGQGHFAYMTNVNLPCHSAYQQCLNNNNSKEERSQLSFVTTADIIAESESRLVLVLAG